MTEEVDNNNDALRKVAAALGASGVFLGAIGAHAFKDTLTKRGTLASWQTATMYQLFHATALLSLASYNESGKISPVAGQLLTAGTLLFSGSIYCLSLGVGPKMIFGPATPLGGLLMIGGWIAVGMSSSTRVVDDPKSN
jgi:uncharacterized membrane protein YgdD (TMEM256/DUF423 family)